jgi:hypothetical protein
MAALPNARRGFSILSLIIFLVAHQGHGFQKASIKRLHHLAVESPFRTVRFADSVPDRVHAQKSSLPSWSATRSKRTLAMPLIIRQATSASDDEPMASLRAGIQKQLLRPFRKAKKVVKSMFGRSSEDFNKTVETLKNESTRKSEAVETDVVPKAQAVAMEMAKVVKEMASSIQIGQRSAVAAPSVDFSGHWNIEVTDEFKEQYDRYLRMLGQPSLVRSIALSIVALTTEEIIQKKQGRDLTIRGRNVRGVWERTMRSSCADEKIRLPVVTADGEEAEVEAWWEKNGSMHVSWMRGVQKYGGGDFESKRYIDDYGQALVCESTFHPSDATREKVQIKWRFRKGDGKEWNSM